MGLLPKLKSLDFFVLFTPTKAMYTRSYISSKQRKAVCFATYCLFVLLFALFFITADAAADIYRYEDTDGVVHFTNAPTDKRFKVYMKDLRKDRQLRTQFRFTPGRNPKEFEQLINSSATRYGVNPALVKAVIRAESGFDPNAVSRVGASGLMQLMPETAKDLNVTNSFDPKQNVDGGVRYLRFLLDTFNGDVSLALAAYNAGLGKVARYGGIPPYQETRTYVNRVLAYMESN